MILSSPCILVCSVDIKTGFCFGCGRTSAEIGSWTDFNEAERQRIMGILEKRLEGVERKPRRMTKRRRIAAGENKNPVRSERQ